MSQSTLTTASRATRAAVSEWSRGPCVHAAPGALLFVGGAMMHTHADTMKAIFEWIPQEAPTLAVDIVHMPDFQAVVVPYHPPPFSPDEVAAASVHAIEQIAVAE